MAFLVEADKVKNIIRRTQTIHSERRENDAEHMWHLSLMAITLSEYAAEPVDLLHVLKMLLIHDLVEIDAGDTFAYDTAGLATKMEREILAAERIFGLLPEDIRQEFRGLWDEFELQKTSEAKFAAALDRLGGLIPNYHNKGGAWKEMQITVDRIKDRNQHIGAGAPALWEYAEALVDEAERQGWIERERRDV
jgi:putative hydrolases of HD superfamily